MNYKSILKSLALILGLIFLVNIDQALYTAVNTKASITYEFGYVYLVVFLRSLVFMILGFILNIKAKRIHLGELRDYRLNWFHVLVKLIPLLILNFLYSPFAFRFNMPFIRGFYSLQVPISNLSFPLSLISVISGYVFATCFEKD